MCNLYNLSRSVAEVARLFRASADEGANFASEVYPGYPGLVVADGHARAMNWGFPLVLTGKDGRKLKPKPVTNARDDKLLTAFWRDSFAKRRCLVPFSAWAEPVGEKGRMTRTWYTLPGEDVFAVAGMWRATAEWGDAYSLVLVDGSSQMVGAHDRMPLILAQQDWARWSHGNVDDALDLCQTWPGEVIADQTGERWAGGGSLSN